MGWKPFAAGLVAGALAVAGGSFLVGRPRAEAVPEEPPKEPSRPSPAFPGGRPIDAAEISTGRLLVERMPEEVTTALERHSDEIVRTAELVATRQARITGTCAPGSAIRVVGEDGSVVCQRLPRGVLSVSALAGVPRDGATRTTQGAVQGAVGRWQYEGDDDFLVVPVELPDGAVVTGFSFTFYDAHPTIDAAAYLYRSDDVPLAVAEPEGARPEVRTVKTEHVREARVDNAGHAYFIYFRTSSVAADDVMPISASVAWKLP
jgi:hypothetical protein